MARLSALFSFLALLLMPLVAVAINLSNNSDHVIEVIVTGQFGRACLKTKLDPGQTIFFENERIACQQELTIEYKGTDGTNAVCTFKAQAGGHIRFDGRACRKC